MNGEGTKTSGRHFLTADAEATGLKDDPTGETLIDAMQTSPHHDLEIEPMRAPMPVREVALSERDAVHVLALENRPTANDRLVRAAEAGFVLSPASTPDAPKREN